MTKEEILSILSKKMNKKEVSALAQSTFQNDDSVKAIIELTFYPIPAIAFRAAWVLETAILNSSEILISNIPGFIGKYTKLSNFSCKRHYTKIMIYMLQKNRGLITSENDIKTVIEVTFDWLIDPKTPVAVKANCLDILFFLKEKSDWIHEELPGQITFLLKDGSAAIQSRGKKLLQHFIAQ